ncbi:class I SAM-dependent methyltransferase [Spiroplasma alleghenense]|uniref:Methyltransferase n=1 Tax=Spiroplasma alleghenense TaxID=216931 RepID=A0A345Z4F0_9MOLU|nr:class I SAM-dependent methyltransferase [Spiroplasma alleghenense]AXK51479.1 methyltransferase [Spiroplasma alleghenense]
MGNYYPSLSGLIYDLTKPVGHSVDGDLEFYYEEIKEINGQILEAGVGTGRMLIPFLRKGIDIEGIDNSQEMLEICKINLLKYKENTTLLLGDLVETEFEKKYEAILMPTGTICLIEEREKVIKLIKKFKSILTKNGKVIIDLIFPSNFKAGTIHSFDYKIDDNRSIKLTNISKEIDWVNQKTISELVYEDFHKEKLVETQRQQFNLNWFGVDEFKAILKEAGFIDIKVIINYGMKRVLNLKTVTIIAK